MLIGLMGYAGVGKSTIARALCRDYAFVAPHIGAPIKAMLAALLRQAEYDEPTIARYVDSDLKRQVIPELGITSTEAQQTIGDWGRLARRDLWLSMWLAKADAILASGGRVVQESVRFADEAAAIQARGGILVEVRRPGFGPLSSHASEAVPAPADWVVENGGCEVTLSRHCATLIAEQLKKNRATDY